MMGARHVYESLVRDAKAMEPHLVAIRHVIHRRPEVGLDLPATQRTVLDALTDLPLRVTKGSETTSVVAVLEGAHPGPTVLLRGDMDALPIDEQAQVPYRSDTPGAMHACGHDIHTAILIGAARLLCDRRDRLAGRVVFMFQPGEEGWNGASVMIREGLLDATGELPIAAYAAHVYSGLIPNGQIAGRDGAITSASAALNVTVRGQGGHASRPHLMKDPVVAACDMVTSLQTAIARRIDVFDPVVVTVGRIYGGTARNIIPDECRFEATVRTYSREAQQRIEQIVRDVCAGVADSHGLDVEVEFEPEYPPMIAAAESAEVLRKVTADLFGADRYTELQRPMYGSEDFAFVLERVPGTYAIIGAAPPGTDLAAAPSGHSATVVFDDGVIADGAALLAGLAVHHLFME